MGENGWEMGTSIPQVMGGFHPPDATAGASGAKLAVLLAKSGRKMVVFPFPERIVGVCWVALLPRQVHGRQGWTPLPKMDLRGVTLDSLAPMKLNILYLMD